MDNSYKIFRKLQEKEKLKKPYKNEDKDSLINIIIEKDSFIEQLQSNWNSLREWFEEKDNNGFEKFYIEDVLYKMNELEGVDNENN